VVLRLDKLEEACAQERARNACYEMVLFLPLGLLY
jgi:hypothetical protein